MKFPQPDEHVLPHEIQCTPPSNISLHSDVDRFTGSLVGLAVGDALGARVEFRPHQFLVDHAVQDMEGGGTWGLKSGQWTDDTSMALCLASSLITKRGYDPYDQMVRYKWWYKDGYMSSTGHCFDIGNATRDSLEKFIYRQKSLIKHFHCRDNELDNLPWDEIQSIKDFNINCSKDGVAGNGALMRLAPVPLFFYKYPEIAVEYAGRSARLTHGDKKAVDACRYYAALIAAAVRGEPKQTLLSRSFYESHLKWFGSVELHPEILRVAQGSYQNTKGYDGGIRGKGYIVNALEAALWAFWSDEGSFEKGALAAVNLGDDTDTTAAIYGQLAGAVYGCKYIPIRWRQKLYAYQLLESMSQWLYSIGREYNPTDKKRQMISSGQNLTKQKSSTNWTSAAADEERQMILSGPNSTKQQSSTNLASAYNGDVSSNIYPVETKHTSKYRSDSGQHSEHHQDTNRSNMLYQDAYQSQMYSSGNSRSSGYPQRIGSSPTHRSYLEQLSMLRTNDNHMPAYGSNFGPPSNHTTGYKGHSLYDSNTSRPSVHGSGITRLASQNYAKDTIANRQINSSESMHGIEQTSRPSHISHYSYDPSQITPRSSLINSLPVYGYDNRYPTNNRPYIASRSNYQTYFSHPVVETTFYNEYKQPTSYSPHTTTEDFNYSGHSMKNYKSHWC